MEIVGSSAILAAKLLFCFFIPVDETPVCTKQLCSVRDNWEQYQATGAEVIGINSDSVTKHQKFAANHNLPLRLLSDADGAITKAYNMKSILGTKRGVVIIDKEGVIRYRKTVIPIFRPADDEILKAIAAIQT